MPHPAAAQATPDRAGRLATEHQMLERTFFSILGRARSGDWHELDAVWDAFVTDVEKHFQFEETLLFPELAKRGDESRRLVEQLREEHAQVRRSLEDLGIRIQLHEVPAAAVAALLQQLRKHAELENQRLYPWAESVAVSS